ncbi:MAG: ABC-F family ATP-binding cassette domain-containing protein [Campylobacterales bacterium]|nr:ABC-F family ATP-binding cassette domain-containing protein [Campylobacterales bacterium]
MIQLTNLTKRFATRELFSNVNFQLGSKQRVGLVGRNGSGKSTLFKMILGEEALDGGEIGIPKNYKIGALRQHLHFSEKTIVDEVALALSEDEKYEIYRVEKMLFGLGFTQEDLAKSPSAFSGGYQIRLNLAKLLIAQPNLLLLDEPTNYLDILSLRWLKAFLKNFDGEVLIITHDRDFMDSVSTHTMGIVRRNLFQIQGGTHKFYAQLAANDDQYEKERQGQEKKRKELEEFIARNKARASTAALAQSKVKLLEKMDVMEELESESKLRFDFNYQETPAKIILEAKDLSFGYTPDNLLFEKISFSLAKGECLGIIGKNGKGKSTLLNVLAGELKQHTGVITSHPATVMGHFGQTNINRLNAENTIIDEIYVGNPKLAFSSVRAICGGMMFSGDDAKKKVSLLSGGEKSRVMLGQILARNVNLLFLDEPTNHLDMESIEALTEAMERFEGSIVLVTHSEELLRRVADRLIVFTSKGAEYFEDGYDAFLEKIGWEEEAGEVKAKKVPKFDKYQVKKLRTALIKERSAKANPLRTQVETLETDIMTREEKLKTLNQELATASGSGDSARIRELSKQVSHEELAVESAFAKLETAQTKLDAVMAEFEVKLEELE